VAPIAASTPEVPPALSTWALTADVGRIPNRLVLRMSAFLHQAPRLTPTTRALYGTQLASEAAIWVSPVPRANPEEFLAAVLAVRRNRELVARTLEAERLSHLGPALTGLPHGFPERG
jgi:hypothetical protein